MTRDERSVSRRVTTRGAEGHQAIVMQPNATTLHICSAAIAMLAACDLPSRELGTKRERWTILEPVDYESTYEALVATPDDGVLLVAQRWYGFHGDSEVRRYAADGSVRWAVPLGEHLSVGMEQTAIAIAADGTIVVAAKVLDPADGTREQGTLFSLDPDGKLLWTLAVEGTTELSAVAVLPDGRLAYGGDIEGVVGAQIGIVSATGEPGPVTQILEPTLYDDVSPVEALAARPTGELVALLMHEGPNMAEVVNLDAQLVPTWTHQGRIGGYMAGIALTPDDSLMLLTHSRASHENADGTDRRVVSDNRITVLDADGNVERELEGAEPDLQAWLIALEPDGTIVLGGADSRGDSELLLGVAEIDPDSLETLFFDSAGRASYEEFGFAENGVSGLVVTASGDIVATGGYDDLGNEQSRWRGWLRRYAARPSEHP